MHIGMFAPGLLPENAANGIVTYVRVMRAALLELGHEVTVFDGERVQWPDGRIEPFLPSTRGRKIWRKVARKLSPRPYDPVDEYALVVDQVRALHRVRPFDVIEMEESFGWARHVRIGVPVVVRLHGPHFLGKDADEASVAAARSVRRIAAEGDAIAHADALTSPSSRLLAETLLNFPTKCRIVEAIPNPISAVSPDRRWNAAMCDPNQMLCVGRFDLRKGADIVLAAFATASVQRPQLKLVMAGPDPGIAQPDGSRIHFADYCNAKLSPDLRARIEFRGRLQADAIATLRQQSAFAVVASRFENFPYSVAESMAVGAATIVSDSFGNGELIEHGVSGLVVPVGDAEALSEAILTLSTSPTLCEAMGTAAYERCETWLGPVQVASRTVNVYERAVAAKHAN